MHLLRGVHRGESGGCDAKRSGALRKRGRAERRWRARPQSEPDRRVGRATRRPRVSGRRGSRERTRGAGVPCTRDDARFEYARPRPACRRAGGARRGARSHGMKLADPHGCVARHARARPCTWRSARRPRAEPRAPQARSERPLPRGAAGTRDILRKHGNARTTGAPLRRARAPRLLALRNPCARLRARALRQVRARSRRRLLVQGPRLLSLVRRPPDGRHRRASGRSRAGTAAPSPSCSASATR